jgi:hypothetical protein
MSWFDSASNLAAATAAHVEPVEFVQLDLPSGTINFQTRTGTIEWGGYYWLGIGQLGRVEAVREDTEVRPNGLKLTLSGVDSALVTAAVSDDYHGSAVAVYLGFLDTTTLALIDTPETVFRGLIDYMAVELGKDSGQIVVNCENELARWSVPRQLLYTPESQSLAGYPADKFFDLVKYMPDRQIDWVKKYAAGERNRRIARAVARP